MSQTEAKADNPTPSAKMSGSALIYSVRWLVHDTFCQALTGKIFWIMLVVSATCIFFCLSVSIDSNLEQVPGQVDKYFFKGTDITPDPTIRQKDKNGNLLIPKTEISMLFGLIRVPAPNRPIVHSVRLLQFFFARMVIGVFGFLLALIWTAGFVPEFLQPNSASVLLAKPIPRWALLVGKYIGVVAFVAFQVSVFFLGTWLALGLRTGVWEYGYLASIPLFVLEFAMIFSFTVLLAAYSRSTVTCIFGSILFWLVCWGMNWGRHVVTGLSLSDSAMGFGSATTFLTELGYWILPKPMDLYILNEQAVHASTFSMSLSRNSAIQQILTTDGYFNPVLSALASFAFTVGILWVAAKQLADTDY